MKINKIRPKFHFLTRLAIKMTHLAGFVLLLKTVSLFPEPFGSRFLDVQDFELY